jgi:alpha-beta hydrolase superfamily lysophospholipase
MTGGYSMRRKAASVLLPAVLCLPALAFAEAKETRASLKLRGQDQPLHLFGPKDGPPVIVASGDGGWTHLGPEVAEFLGDRGFAVVGFDSKHYLSSFTSGSKTLAPEEVPGDFRALVDYARAARPDRVLLLGVSEGAGLAVLAAADPGLRPSLRGVMGLGLPDVNELGWRFADSIIYVTHKVPNEPTFKASDYLPRVGSLPVIALHATRDEFVPVDEVARLMGLPGGPRKLVVIDAADHRFSDKGPELQKAILDALAWIDAGGR